MLREKENSVCEEQVLASCTVRMILRATRGWPIRASHSGQGRGQIEENWL